MGNLRLTKLSNNAQPTTLHPVKTQPDAPTHLRQADFIQQFHNTNGLIIKACDLMHLKYSTYKNWLKDPKFKSKMEDAQQKVNEMMEDSLIQKAMTTNSPVPEIFYLKSRDSRYSQRVSLEGEEDKPIVMTYSSDTLKTINKAITEMLEKE